jgi:hypothetical protein
MRIAGKFALNLYGDVIMKGSIVYVRIDPTKYDKDLGNNFEFHLVNGEILEKWIQDSQKDYLINQLFGDKLEEVVIKKKK